MNLMYSALKRGEREGWHYPPPPHFPPSFSASPFMRFTPFPTASYTCSPLTIDRTIQSVRRKIIHIEEFPGSFPPTSSRHHPVQIDRWVFDSCFRPVAPTTGLHIIRVVVLPVFGSNSGEEIVALMKEYGWDLAECCGWDLANCCGWGLAECCGWDLAKCCRWDLAECCGWDLAQWCR